MNNINWRGRVDYYSVLVFETEASASPKTPIPPVTFIVYPGYTPHHVAAAFTRAWNAVAGDQFLALTEGTHVRFPGLPVHFTNRRVTVDGNEFSLPVHGPTRDLQNGLSIDCTDEP